MPECTARSLISALAGTSALPVYAQDTEIEQIVVTGSRIKMANIEGAGGGRADQRRHRHAGRHAR